MVNAVVENPALNKEKKDYILKHLYTEDAPPTAMWFSWAQKAWI